MCVFRDAKVGNEVYDICWGKGEIIQIAVLPDDLIEIQVMSKSDRTVRWYDEDGMIKEVFAENPTLFWSKPDITPPPRPKRKVKKEGWINLKVENGIARVVRTGSGPSQGRSVHDDYNAAWANSCSDAMKPIKIDYEVDE